MNKTISNNFKYSYGVTLVELMIAIVVSSILMLGIIEIFSINNRSFKVQDENARMQESGRFAFNILMQDIRRAGYFGGNANKEDTTGSIGIAPPARDCNTADTTWGRMIERPIYGLNDTNSDIDVDGVAVDYSAGCIPDADYNNANGGDILVTRYTKGTPLTVFDADRLYIRNSLFSGRLFKGSEAADVGPPTNQVTETPNAVHELAASAYYVGPSGRNCRFDNNVSVPALFREILSSTGLPIQEEVANGIEVIQFKYGVDSNTDLSVNRYYDANDLSNNTAISPNWTQVVTVRFWVLVRADCPTNDYNNTKTYVMGDIPGGYTPGDAFKRQLYSSTVSVRN